MANTKVQQAQTKIKKFFNTSKNMPENNKRIILKNQQFKSRRSKIISNFAKNQIKKEEISKINLKLTKNSEIDQKLTKNSEIDQKLAKISKFNKKIDKIFQSNQNLTEFSKIDQKLDKKQKINRKLTKNSKFDQKLTKIDQKIEKNEEKIKISGRKILKHYRSGRNRPLLPLKFENLLKMFKAVENTMALHYSRNKIFVTMEDLKNSVQLQIKKKFDKVEMGRIIKISPEFYEFRNLLLKEKIGGWRSISKLVVKLLHKIEMDKKTEIEKTFYLNEKIRQFRETIFENRIFIIVKKAHDKFLEKHKIAKFDTTIYNEWHVDFPLELVELPEPCKPLQQPLAKNFKQNFNNPILKNRHQSCLASKFLIEKIKNNNFSNNSCNENLTQKTPKILKSFKSSIISKIREKSLIQNTIFQNEKNNSEIKNLEILKQIVKATNEHLIYLKRNKIKISVLGDFLKSCDFTKELSKNETINLIKKLNEMKPFWCKMVGKNDDVFMIDRKIKVKAVIDEINDKIKRYKC